MAPGEMHSGLSGVLEAQTNTGADDDLDLVPIIAGSVLGAMMAVLVLLMCVRCLKFQKTHGLSYAVSDNSGSQVNIVSFHGVSSDPSPRPTYRISSAVDNISQDAIHQQQIRTSDYHKQPPNTNNNNNSDTVKRIDQHINNVIQGSKVKDSSNNNGRSNESSSVPQDTYGKSGNVRKTTSKSSVEKRPSILRHLSFSKRSIITSPSSYGRLEEDGHSIAESHNSQGSEGIDNPVFMRGAPARGSIMSDDTLSVLSTDTLKRRNRMRSESAAAIAVLRTSQVTVNFDDDFIIDDNDVILEVVFNERTEL